MATHDSLLLHIVRELALDGDDETQKLADTYLKADALTPTQVAALQGHVQQSIEQMCDNVTSQVSMFHPSVAYDAHGGRVSASMVLPRVVKVVQQMDAYVDRTRAQVTDLKQQAMALATTYVRVILEILDVLRHVILEFKCDFDFEKNATLDRWLDARARAFQIQVHHLYTTIRQATYPPHVVHALAQLNAKLTDRANDANALAAKIDKKCNDTAHPTIQKLIQQISTTSKNIQSLTDHIARLQSQDPDA
ncbi:hypothetical protein BC940DRAFT_367458 [Gongronella butleri]|nr:hypothetical protein BC940DRAFT_367458 [Gongronella butleri]